MRLAFYWHFHQPYYRNDQSGEVLLPWVRLHACKDYMGMGLLLARHPGIKATFNFVPSLLAQLRLAPQLPSSDSWYQVSARPAEQLSQEDRGFLLRHFFSCQWDRMVEPYPRYAELLALRGYEDADIERAAQRFSPAELRDLQVWFNLTWFHALVLEKHPHIAELKRKGRDFTEADKQEVLTTQLQVMGEVVPLYRELAARGQVELTFTPYYHPILPLLVNFENHREAHPGAPLPRGWESLVEDADLQIRRGIEAFTEAFGVKPRGMWPAEGSVSADMVGLMARHGVAWFATDERILAESRGRPLERDRRRLLVKPQDLYRPYRALSKDGPFVLFRDQMLSDLIGFEYQRLPFKEAVADFLSVLDHGRRRCDESALAPIILDGENAWEHYQDGGVPFLDHLYTSLAAQADRFPTTCISQALDGAGEPLVLERLFAGSWINRDFSIWAGHEEDRRAWEALFAARKELTQAEAQKGADPHQIERAREEILIAEGSDWFWWYGDEHSSAHDGEFDGLFRAHLRNVYTVLGKTPPTELDLPISARAERPLFDAPRGQVAVTVDGEVSSFFEWMGAGAYHPGRAGNAMHKGRSRFGAVYFGFDLENAYFRFDPPGESAPLLGEGESLCLRFPGPPQREVRLKPQNGGFQVECVIENLRPDVAQGLRCAYNAVLELQVPFDTLGFRVHQTVRFYAVLMRGDTDVERAPPLAPLSFRVPDESIDTEHWGV